MKRTSNASLKSLNSFSIEARAGQLMELESQEDLKTFAAQHEFDPDRDLILGAGSNILFTGDIPGTVVLNHVTGKSIIDPDVAPDAASGTGTVQLDISAGENWHQLVLWSLKQGLSGLENLSLIPGLAGAAPIQNIGAYGVELSDLLDSVRVLELHTGEFHQFSRQECEFSYRNSLFKAAAPGRYMITNVVLKLQRTFSPVLTYRGLRDELSLMGIDEEQSPTAIQVSDAVIQIRQRKLPDPAVIPNAGSFFKNPVVPRSVSVPLSEQFPALPVHAVDKNTDKLSAAWMIEQCGWKGQSMGDAAVSDRHALVLVNRGQATGLELLKLANSIRQSVLDSFGVELQPEPRIVRF